VKTIEQSWMSDLPLKRTPTQNKVSKKQKKLLLEETRKMVLLLMESKKLKN